MDKTEPSRVESVLRNDDDVAYSSSSQSLYAHLHPCGGAVEARLLEVSRMWHHRDPRTSERAHGSTYAL
jgi:hypothetical protein